MDSFPFNDRIVEKKVLRLPHKPVLYWMSREQRVDDNYSLLFSLSLANELETHVDVFFTFVDDFPGASESIYSFMLQGLKQVEIKLKQYNIAFSIVKGSPLKAFKELRIEENYSAIVTDFDPLRIKREWQEDVRREIDLSLFVIDSHNIVPLHKASNKQEFGAYTLRPKIHKMLPLYLVEPPNEILSKHQPSPNYFTNNWSKLNNKSQNFGWHCAPGESHALKQMNEFIQTKVEQYSQQQSNPCIDGTSRLSAYLHFGQISSLRILIELMKAKTGQSIDQFIEQLVIRKELTDNYCYYNPHYDQYRGFPDWARKSLEEHWIDQREYYYSVDELEYAQTHDPLWNAAQQQMIKNAYMHNYMRMYWAKKILEWTENPEEALRISIYLNDKYQLDGRDPNGYVGCAWSIGGVHDRAWTERPVYGKIRYMNYNGCKRKFDVNKYISQNKI